ncbi:MAG TPA: ECF-type sigma factor [Gemmatimonadaceae bacterium]|nr:ECF-type sigma factor [Gemmatimonadaceae bacterium]
MQQTVQRDIDAVFPQVYGELRRLAHAHLRRERAGHTLSTTDLVHEAYVRLADSTGIPVQERPRFFVIAATAMRRVLIEYARRRQAAKRGGTAEIITLEADQIAADESSEMLIALDEALTRLASIEPRLASVVECRYFGGLTEDETAEALGITARTVRRDWVKAKEWLYAELR